MSYKRSLAVLVVLAGCGSRTGIDIWQARSSGGADSASDTGLAGASEDESSEGQGDAGFTDTPNAVPWADCDAESLSTLELGTVDRTFVDNVTFDDGELVFAGPGELLFVDPLSGSRRRQQLKGWPNRMGMDLPEIARCPVATNHYFFIADSNGRIYRYEKANPLESLQHFYSDLGERLSCVQAVSGSESAFVLGADGVLVQLFDSGDVATHVGVLRMAVEEQMVFVQKSDGLHSFAASDYDPVVEKRVDVEGLSDYRLVGVREAAFLARSHAFDNLVDVVRLGVFGVAPELTLVAQLPLDGEFVAKLADRGIVWSTTEGALWGASWRTSDVARVSPYVQRSSFDEDDFRPDILIQGDTVYWFAGPHGDEEYLTSYATSCES